ncbi:chitin synthase III catalytic subunit [Dipodascopsis tothii]|uniref:chitin synthase III catalytic subunit n=1 Tax=Dipodascopsis tothii TaxID=44089 RepID=UPI0034CF915B
MGYGDFMNFCRGSTLPVCNLFLFSDEVEPYCTLSGFTSGSTPVRNLGVIFVGALAVVMVAAFLYSAQRRTGAVGRREMQVLFLAYGVAAAAMTVASSGIVTGDYVLTWFSAAQIGATTATAWALLLNGLVTLQFMADGSVLSVALTLLSTAMVGVGTGYIAADTDLAFSGAFEMPYNPALYTLFLVLPLICVVAYVVLEIVLVVRILRELKPLFPLLGAFVCFAVAMAFEFGVSQFICRSTDGRIDGSFFAALFTLLSFMVLRFYWYSITEDTYVAPHVDSYYV